MDSKGQSIALSGKVLSGGLLQIENISRNLVKSALKNTVKNYILKKNKANLQNFVTSIQTLKHNTTKNLTTVKLLILQDTRLDVL